MLRSIKQVTQGTRTAIVADPFPLMLEAVERVIGTAGVEVVGSATSLTQATERIREVTPDVVVAEIAWPYEDAAGVGWVRDTLAEFPDVRIVVFSMSGDPESVNAALRAGAASYVLKDAPPGDLAAAVRQTFYHSIFLPGALETGSKEGEPGGLTKRQAEILRLAAEGMSNAQLARKLWVTEQTVKFHLSNTYRKLGVSNRTEAARWAQLNGLIPNGADSSPVSTLSLQAVGS